MPRIHPSCSGLGVSWTLIFWRCPGDSSMQESLRTTEWLHGFGGGQPFMEKIIWPNQSVFKGGLSGLWGENPSGGRKEPVQFCFRVYSFTSLCPLPPVLVAKSQTSSRLEVSGVRGLVSQSGAEPCVICNGQCGVRRGLHRGVCGADAASGRNPGRMADLSEHRGPVHWQVTR